jgi:hypothetical protein
MGERGSPCLSPRWCLISSPSWPFTKIHVDAVRSRLEMRFRHIGPKPKCARTSIINAHDTESNAFDMSSFKNRLGTFCLNQTWNMFSYCVYLVFFL